MKFLKQATLFDYALAKTIKICPNQHTDLLRCLFTGDSLKMTSFQATFFIDFFDKNFSFVILHKLAKFHHGTVFTSQVIQ